MTPESVLLTALISAVCSGIVATALSIYYQARLTRRYLKIDCLRRVAGYRSMPPTTNFTEALNEIVITFNDSKDVMTALGQFDRTIQLRGGHLNDDLVRLIKAMMKDVGMGQKELSEDFFLRPFRPNNDVLRRAMEKEMTGHS